MHTVPKDYLDIYVDGSYWNGIYSGGYVIYDNDKIIYQDCGIGQSSPELIKMRNISGEMTACMRAVHWVHKNKQTAIIHHDYNGLSKWVTGEWQTNNPYTKMYAEYVRPFYNSGVIGFHWVKGHTGIEGNEIADKLAKQAITYKQQWRF